MAANEAGCFLPRSIARPLFDQAKWSLEWRRLKHQYSLLKKWWLRPHTAYQPVFVVATCRSGSNLLVSYLNQLQNVAMHGEVLCPLVPTGPRQHRIPAAKALRHIRYSLQARPASIRGCKLMLYQLADCSLTLDVLDSAFPGSKYVVLYRQSLADQFVSQKLALATRQWVLMTGQERKQATVTIDAVELRNYCDATRRAYRDVIATPWLRERAVLLSYEDLTADPAAQLAERICPFLGVRAVAPQSTLRKQNTLPVAERVANYDEVEALLASPLCRQHYVWPWQPQEQRRAG
jgi:LPS sulfotransferase NodH